jgi:lipid-A-disaccharide synthase
MLSCGEPSGDLYAGALTRELCALDPTITVSGLGGPRFAAAGGELIADYRGLAVTGLTEWIGKLPQLLATRRRLVAWAEAVRPDALVVIDFPDFNFRLASGIKQLGIPVVYYVSPQIWAWRAGRLKTLRQIADRVLVIFPFEEAIYRKGGVPVTFVGHPLVELAQPADREAFLTRLRLSPGSPTVAILPGSRPNEVHRILPVLIAAIELIRRRVADVQFVVARAPGLPDGLFDALPALRLSTDAPPRGGHTRGDGVAVVEGETDAVLASADIALTASGTATVQSALHDTPMVIVYRVSPFTYLLARQLVTVDTFGMVNIIAGQQIVPELIQGAFTPDSVAREAVSILTDRARHARIREGLARVRQRLGGPCASRRAAEAILAVSRQRASVRR